MSDDRSRPGECSVRECDEVSGLSQVCWCGADASVSWATAESPRGCSQECCPALPPCQRVKGAGVCVLTQAHFHPGGQGAGLQRPWTLLQSCLLKARTGDWLAGRHKSRLDRDDRRRLPTTAIEHGPKPTAIRPLLRNCGRMGCEAQRKER